MKPEAVDVLASEADQLKRDILNDLAGSPPAKMAHLFSDSSFFFQEEVLSKWREQGRFDEIIDCVLYQYDERGGEEFWKQVLLDLRLNEDYDRAFRLLDGLLPGRMEQYRAAAKSKKRFPSNYLSAANLSIATGEVMKVLYEYAYILENRSPDKVDKMKICRIKGEIEIILSAQQGS